MTTTKKVAPTKKAAKAVESKPTAAERLAEVLVLIDRQSTAPTIDGVVQVKYGKAIPLMGGGSVYINRGNADVRGTTGQVAAWAKSIKGSTVRGPQGQYLRITF